MHYKKKDKAKKIILLHFHTLFLPWHAHLFSIFFSLFLSCTLFSSSSSSSSLFCFILFCFIFFFYYYYFFLSFSLARYFSANDSQLSSVFRFGMLGCFMGFANWNFVYIYIYIFLAANLCVSVFKSGEK